MKVTGFDQLTKQIAEAEKAIAEIDGDLGSVHFDPADPVSIEQAIVEMEGLIDSRLSHYASNPIVADLSRSLKEQYRQAILDRATEARLSSASQESGDDPG